MHLARRGLWLTLLAIAALAVSACGPEEISNKQAEHLIEGVASDIGRHLGEVPSGESSLKSTLVEAGEADRDQIERTEPPYDAIVDAAYEQLDYTFRLTAGPGADIDPAGKHPSLTGRGAAIVGALERIEAHALQTDAFERAAIRNKLSDADDMYSQLDEIRSLELTDDERQAAIAWLTGKQVDSFVSSDADTHALETSTFLEEWLADKEASRLSEKRARLRELADKWVDVRIELERLLATHAARYARSMKHFKLREPYIHPRHDDYWSDPITDGRRPDKKKGPYRAGQVWRQAVQIARNSANKAEVLNRRIRQTVTGLVKAEDKQQAADRLEDLQPNHPQYDGLVDAYERYRQYASNGGWNKVPVTPGLEPGVEHETVKQLKRRLQTEGFYPSDASIDATYGDALQQAVEAYQQTHQMEVSGEPHSMFWKSLNTSATQRARQIALNLRRWREAKVDHSDDLYVLVNIPDFNVEVWKNQTRKMRFPIVVGNHDTKRVKPTNDRGEVIEDAPKETVHPNHTPTFSAYIDRVIYNPYWNVTDRIREEEVLPKVRQSVVATYKEKLKSLKKKARERQQQKPSTGARPPTAATDGQGLESTGAEPTLTATNRAAPDASNASSHNDTTNSDDTSTGQAAASDQRQSASQLPGLGSDSDGDGTENQTGSGAAAPESTDNAGGDDADGSGDEPSGSADTDEPAEQQAVDISNLFEQKEVTVDDKRDIEETRTVFDVDAIRELLATVHAPKPSNASEGATDGPDGSRSGDEQTSPGDEADKPATSSSEESGDSESLLEKEFPYLKPDKGWVDVSSTDPDHVPSWYAENYYEVVFPGREWEYVRVIPGAHNALGRVKVIFPNQHSVYLHDTPKKHLFSRNLRAFSHGCMRMEKPLDFAEFLLRQQGLYTDQHVDSLLEGERVPWSTFKKENNFDVDDPSKVMPTSRLVETSRGIQVIDYEYRPIFLSNMIPVHVQYMTVRVDQEGRPHFLADIYDKDEQALAKDG